MRRIRQISAAFRVLAILSPLGAFCTQSRAQGIAVSEVSFGGKREATKLPPKVDTHRDPQTQIAIDCSVPPKAVERDVLPECRKAQDGLTAADARVAFGFDAESLLKVAASYRVTESPAMLSNLSKLVDATRKQIKDSLPKINSFLKTYCIKGAKEISVQDLEEQVTPDRVIVMDDDKWHEFHDKYFADSATRRESGSAYAWYHPGAKKIVIRTPSMQFATDTTLAHEFMHHLLWVTSPEMSIEWHHFLLMGDPSHGFLAWAGGGPCYPDCLGFMAYGDNYYWHPETDPYASVLAADKPIPLQGQVKAWLERQIGGSKTGGNAQPTFPPPF